MSARALLTLLPLVAAACTSTPTLDVARDVVAERGVVVSVSREASAAGATVLAEGGNAVDAAIATAFALAVTHPSAGNIGGGGFMLVHPGGGGDPLFFDYREKAPLASTRDMFVELGSRKNHRYVGVPGTVHGLALAHERLGTLPWARLVEPAVALAADGFVVHEGLARSLNGTLRRSNNDEFVRVYGHPDGREWAEGDRLVLPDLAATLERIRDGGADGFYSGRTAELLANEMERGGGYITLEDLRRYRAQERTPIHFTYRDFDVYSAPPPSSGGITLAQMLQILEPHELRERGRWAPATLHLTIEAMRRAYAQRATHLGDPDFVDIDPVLWTKPYALSLGESIDLERATPSASLGPSLTLAPESAETTHFSVVDANGMAVSNTYTLEAGYGSGVVVTGAGFLLNNEMGDFNPRPGVTNDRGLIGTAPNQVEPEKRMLSSMTPTIAARNGDVFLVTGSPGGRTIINTVLCVTLNVLEFGMTAREAVDAPRMDHEWFPERVRIVDADESPLAEVAEALRAMGHDVQASRGQGDAHTILIDEQGRRIGAADARHGAAAGY